MLIRKLCLTISKTHHNPLIFSPIITNPFAISISNPLSLTNFKTPKLGFKKPFSSNSHAMSNPTRPAVVSIPYPHSSSRSEVFRALEASLGTTFSSHPIVPNPNPLIIVVSGPSGVGKDAVIKRLREVREDLHFVVTATSRGKRDGEIEGKDYYFVSKEEFRKKIDRDELLEYAMVYGDYKGIPKDKIREFMAKGCDVVLRVDIQGAATLRGILGSSGVFVFLVAESEAALVNRLIERKTETPEALLMRVAAAKEELKHVKEFDYVVENKEGELERSVGMLESIIDAEKAKVQQRRAVV